MPIQYLIDTEHSCIIEVWIGEVTSEEWCVVERQVIEIPNLPRNAKWLIDARKVREIKINEANVSEIVDFYKNDQA